MTKLVSTIIAAVAAGGILAGTSGLMVAGGTRADVSALKKAQPEVEARLGAVEQGLASLKGAVDERARRDEEFRTEQRLQLMNIDGKLQRLLEGDF